MIEVPLPSLAPPEVADDICHDWCCQGPTIAICGKDVTDARVVDDEVDCVVCANTPCPVCGNPPP